MKRLFALLLLAQSCVCSQRAARPEVPVVKARADRAGSVRFIALGDTGMDNDAQYQVAGAMARHCAARGCDFVLLLGDNIYRSGARSADDPQFQAKFELPYAPLDLPFYVSFGNHDYGHGGLGDDFAVGANEIAYSARSRKWKLPASHYRFSEGPVDLVALDTQRANFGQDPGQADEVAGWLQSSNARWKIAFGHHPYLSNGPHGNAGHYAGVSDPRSGEGVKELLERAVCGKADLYLCGHDHSRQWLKASCGGTELAVSGAGAETTSLSPRNEVRFQASTLGFLYVTASESTLVAEFIDAAGRVDFSRTLQKAQGRP